MCEVKESTGLWIQLKRINELSVHYKTNQGISGIKVRAEETGEGEER